MPAAPKDIVALNSKLERAEHHLFNLKDFWTSFIDEEKAYPILFQDAADGSHRLYYLGSVAPIPADVPLIMGDAVQALRSALDHMAYRLVCVGTASDGPFTDVYFPTAETPDKFEAKIKTIEKRLAPEAVKQLRKVAAYQGGNGEIIWHIDRLNNIDKHRLLPTVTSQNRMHSMSPVEIAKIRRDFLGELSPVPEALDPKLFLKEGIRHISLEAGHILDIFPISQVHDNMHFPIELAFGQPPIIKGKPVLETLHQASHLIYQLFMSFDSLGLFD
jgi:hypothetical protein